MSRNLNELQERYEEEFLAFLIQKINHAGGSLQFQHLSGLLQQLKFEIRDTFGVTKPELMKFLKARSNIFSISSKGVVTLVKSATLDNNEFVNQEENKNTNIKKTFVPKIENGKGHIFKVFPGYAIIKTMQTYIFFTPLEYGAEKESVFNMDIDLPLRTKVCFNAVHGHSDFEIEYRATKVWKEPVSDDESPQPESFRRNKTITKNKLTGEGIIKVLSPSVCQISVVGKGNETVFFFGTSIKDVNVGDRVEFVAEYNSNKWQAIEIIKKRKDSLNKSGAHSQACNRTSDKHDDVQNKIMDQAGKIYPYSNSKGAMIKFGKNYSELVDGSSCDFYLYGLKVMNSDIAFEFSEGDEVKFDAIKSKKSRKWKAILVWAGEKPFIKDIDKMIDELNEMSDDSESIDVSLKTKNNSKEINSVNKRHKFINETKMKRDSSNSRNMNSFSDEYYKNNIVASKTLSYKDSNYNKNKCKNKQMNRKSTKKYNQKKISRITDIDNVEKSNEYLPVFKDVSSSLSDSSEIASEENNELQESLHCLRKFLKEDEQYSNVTSEFEKNLMDEAYNDNENEKITLESEKSFSKSKSSIRRFEAIDGKISKVLCKLAFIKSVHLRKEPSFVLNAFFINGKSVEELQITDLNETIKVGDVVQFNCFEIIDDYGEAHQKVTLVWKGPKPDTYETTPEEFISEECLHVSVFETDYECKLEKNFDATRNINCSESFNLNAEAGSSLNSRPSDLLNEYPMLSKNRTDNVDEHLSSVIECERLPKKDVQHEKLFKINDQCERHVETDAQCEKLSEVDGQHKRHPKIVQDERLPDVIFKKLETYGFVFSDPEIAVNAVHEIIDLVLKNSSFDESFNSSVPQVIESASVCSSCEQINQSFNKEAVNTEVQTVITGDIVATSIFTEVS